MHWVGLFLLALGVVVFVRWSSPAHRTERRAPPPTERTSPGLGATDGGDHRLAIGAGAPSGVALVLALGFPRGRDRRGGMFRLNGLRGHQLLLVFPDDLVLEPAELEVESSRADPVTARWRQR